MATTKTEKTESKFTPRSRVYKSRDRKLMKRYVETLRGFLGRRLTASETSGAAYFTFPLTSENVASTK